MLATSAVVPDSSQPVTVSVILVAYGSMPHLSEALDALSASEGVTVEVIVVDNGSDAEAAAVLADRPDVRVVRPGTNLGFAGGVRAGVDASSGEVIALVGTDALVDPDALAELAAVAIRSEVGIATGLIELADRPGYVNSAGNDLHYLGLSWSGGFAEPVAAHRQPRAVTCGSGCGMALRRVVWDRLGGFCTELFAYQEDAELSLRVWQAGLEVRYVPSARVVHHYAFGRHPTKLYLLDRNRLILVLTCYSTRLLMALAPLLLVQELALLVASVAGGWWRSKLRSWWWLLTHVRFLRARRQDVQSARVVPDAELAHRFVAGITAANLDLPPIVAVANPVLSGAWWLVRRSLPAS